MRRVFSWIALVVVLAIALPPLFYAVTGEPQEDLPPADARYAVSGNVSVAAIERGRAAATCSFPPIAAATVEKDDSNDPTIASP